MRDRRTFVRLKQTLHEIACDTKLKSRIIRATTMNNENQNIEYKRIWQDDNLKSLSAFSVPVCHRHQMLMVQVVQPYNLTTLQAHAVTH